VSIVDRRQLFSDKPRHRLNEMSLMSHGDLFRFDAKIDKLTDQPTGNGIRVGSNEYGAALTDSHALDDVVGVEPFIRQSVQVREILKEFLLPILIGSFHQAFHESDVLFTTGKITAAAQQ